MSNLFFNFFSDAMADLSLSSERLMPAGKNSESRQAVERICDLLKIAKLEIMYQVAESSNKIFMQNEMSVLFSRDGWDGEKPLMIVKQNEDDSSFHFYIYPYKDSDEWTEDYLHMIGFFVSQVYLVNDRSRIAAVAEKFAVMDSEMELYNLRYLMSFMRAMFSSGEIREYCACRFNIANMAIVNSKIGRSAGTEVMKKYVYGLKEILGIDGFISRLGGDNFITLFKKGRINTVMDYLSEHVVATNVRGIDRISVSAHAGYYIVDEYCRRPHEIMEAIIAAEIAARINKAPYAVFDSELKKRTEAKKILEGLFYDAIDNEEFIVYYQPKVNLKSYTLSGAEALCRWQHDGELIQPFRFIPILEQSHNICILDFYVLEHVCKDMRRWINSGMPVVKVSVNLSRMHLGDERLAERITETIDRYNIPHEYIEIELTETTTDVNFKELKKIVSSLHELGINTSVDDFGVGYSSLNLIRDLPWNVLKIDKSFLPCDTDDNKDSKEIMLKYVISMAQELGLECIVEGVESLQQVELLKGFGCFRAQGFFFDKPLAVNAFESRLRDCSKYIPKK